MQVVEGLDVGEFAGLLLLHLREDNRQRSFVLLLRLLRLLALGLERLGLFSGLLLTFGEVRLP